MFSRFAKPEQVKVPSRRRSVPKNSRSWNKMMKDVEKMIAIAHIDAISQMCELVKEYNHPDINKIRTLISKGTTPERTVELAKRELAETSDENEAASSQWREEEQGAEVYESDTKATVEGNGGNYLFHPLFDSDDEEWVRKRRERKSQVEAFFLRRRERVLLTRQQMHENDQRDREENKEDSEESQEPEQDENASSGSPPDQFTFEETLGEDEPFNEWNVDVDYQPEADENQEIGQVEVEEPYDEIEPEPDEHFNKIILELEQQIAVYLYNKMMGTTEDDHYFNQAPDYEGSLDYEYEDYENEENDPANANRIQENN